MQDREPYLVFTRMLVALQEGWDRAALEELVAQHGLQAEWTAAQAGP